MTRFNSLTADFGENDVTISCELIRTASFGDIGSKLQMFAKVDFNVSLDTLDRFAKERYLPTIITDYSEESQTYPMNYTKGYASESHTVKEWLECDRFNCRLLLHQFCVENHLWVISETNEQFFEEIEVLKIQG